MFSPGTQLEQLCASAQQEITFVAPFIKAGALARLLELIPPNVILKCVTRWRPEEIAAGVSDLEVWTLIKARNRSSLWLRPDLHAKFYRADETCLVGSANLTFTALGWSAAPNLELLVTLPIENLEVADFEASLFRNCVQADDNLFDQVLSAVKILVAEHPIVWISQTFSESEPAENIPSIDAWLPTLRDPKSLYAAYCGQVTELTTASRDTAITDLESLDVPVGLAKKAFEACVGIALLQKPIVQQVDKFVATPQRFGAVSNRLRSLPCAKNPNFDSQRAWQTLMRWLLYFFPDRYQVFVPNHSELFGRIRKIKV